MGVLAVSTISATNPVIVLDYHNLVADKDHGDAIKIAYGVDGLGILVVKNVPKLAEARQNLLPLAYQYARCVC